MPSPIASINGGAAGAKASVSAGGAVVATLVSIDGVRSCTWSISRTDETSTAANYTLVPSGSVGQTVSTTALTAGKAATLKAVVNSGLDANGNFDASLISETKFFVPTAEGLEVAVTSETKETALFSNSIFGIIELLNEAVRLISSSATDITRDGSVNVNEGTVWSSSTQVKSAIGVTALYTGITATGAVQGATVVGTTSVTGTGHLAQGATPAASGAVRLTGAAVVNAETSVALAHGGTTRLLADSSGAAVTGRISGTTFLALGAAPAQSGTLRLERASTIAFRNQAGSVDIALVAVDASNNLFFGSLSDSAGTYIESTNGVNLRRAGGAMMAAFSSTGAVVTGLVSATTTVDATTALRQGASPPATGSVRLDGVATINGATSVALQAGGTTRVLAGSTSVDVTGDDINLTGAVTITGNTTIPTGNTIQLAGTSALLCGGTPAQAGAIRLTYADQILYRNSADGGNVLALSIATVNGTVDTLSLGSTTMTEQHYAKNVAFFGGSNEPAWPASKTGIVYFANSGAVPTTGIASGALIYADTGALKAFGSGGTGATLVAAEPHCQRCGRDCVVEHENKREGWHICVCMWCLTDAMKDAGVMHKTQV